MEAAAAELGVLVPPPFPSSPSPSSPRTTDQATMTPVAHPDHPAVSDYPTEGPHAALVETAKALFLAELASNEGWEDHGEREGVQLYKKPDPEVRPEFL